MFFEVQGSHWLSSPQRTQMSPTHTMWLLRTWIGLSSIMLCRVFNSIIDNILGNIIGRNDSMCNICAIEKRINKRNKSIRKGRNNFMCLISIIRFLGFSFTITIFTTTITSHTLLKISTIFSMLLMLHKSKRRLCSVGSWRCSPTNWIINFVRCSITRSRIKSFLLNIGSIRIKLELSFFIDQVDNVVKFWLTSATLSHVACTTWYLAGKLERTLDITITLGCWRPRSQSCFTMFSTFVICVLTIKETFWENKKIICILGFTKINKIWWNSNNIIATEQLFQMSRINHQTKRHNSSALSSFSSAPFSIAAACAAILSTLFVNMNSFWIEIARVPMVTTRE